MNLTPKQRKGIDALMVHATVVDAAQAVGISRATLFRWLRDESFRTELRRAGNELIDGTTRKLASLSARAVAALEDVLNDPDAGHVLKIRAAGEILGRLLHLREMVELSERMDAIETRLNEAGETNVTEQTN